MKTSIDQINEWAKTAYQAWLDCEEDKLIYRVEVSRSTGCVVVVPITSDGEDAILHSHEGDVLGYAVLSEIKSWLPEVCKNIPDGYFNGQEIK